MKVFLIGMITLSVSHGAISTNNYTPATNDRFANDASFIGAGFDFSGVGRASNGRWATLIDDNVFISAGHFAPSGTVSFYEDNNPSSMAVSRNIVGGTQISIGGQLTDIYVGHLDFALPNTIKRYSYDSTLRTGNTRIASPQQVYLVGLSPTITGYGASNLTNMAVGTNRLEYFIEDAALVDGLGTVISNTDAYLSLQNETNDRYATSPTSLYDIETYESDLNGGDSGGPAFITSGGQLVLTGLNTGSGTTVENPVDDMGNPLTGFFTNPAAGDQTRNTQLISYLGNYQTGLNDYVTANLNTLVPEPSSTLLLGCSLFGFALRRVR